MSLATAAAGPTVMRVDERRWSCADSYSRPSWRAATSSDPTALGSSEAKGATSDGIHTPGHAPALARHCRALPPAATHPAHVVCGVAAVHRNNAARLAPGTIGGTRPQRVQAPHVGCVSGEGASGSKGRRGGRPADKWSAAAAPSRWATSTSRLGVASVGKSDSGPAPAADSNARTPEITASCAWARLPTGSAVAARRKGKGAPPAGRTATVCGIAVHVTPTPASARAARATHTAVTAVSAGFTTRSAFTCCRVGCEGGGSSLSNATNTQPGGGGGRFIALATAVALTSSGHATATP
mmetsp:Transcript_22261/g.69095  ORF Transcript_22261/g.69095 Transcript_22261/m.69095 type:complete len:297 (+) Transcript_22261:221-1111(+)